MTGLEIDMENQLLTLLQLARDEGDESARSELNDLLRNDPEARKTMARLLVDEQALIGHLRDESIVSLLSPFEPQNPTTSASINRRPLLPIGAGLAAGLVLGLLCMSVAFGFSRPRTLISSLHVADANFDTLSAGPIERGFSTQFGKWSGDPLEVITESDGNQRLRFMATGNVKGNPSGGASACNAFQFIDLTALQRQSQNSDAAGQNTLELSVYFERDPTSAIDEEFPAIKSGCAIYLFETDPQSVIQGWPNVLNDAVAIGRKKVRIKPGKHSEKITTTCVLEPEATIALITLDVGIGRGSQTPVKLGNYYADDVQLSLVTHPKLPIQIEKK